MLNLSLDTLSTYSRRWIKQWFTTLCLRHFLVWFISWDSKRISSCCLARSGTAHQPSRVNLLILLALDVIENYKVTVNHFVCSFSLITAFSLLLSAFLLQQHSIAKEKSWDEANLYTGSMSSFCLYNNKGR